MTILVTRPEPAATELVRRLHSRGLMAWSLPLVEFTPGKALTQLLPQLAKLGAGDLIFALSQQAIRYAHSHIQRSNAAWPQQPDYYAIGRTTALALHKVSGYNVEYPREHETSEMLIQLAVLQQVKDKQAVILCGNGGRDLLAKTLAARGAKVTLCECYQRCYHYYDGAIEGRRWRDRGIKTLVVTSGEMLQHLFDLIPPIDREQWLLHCWLIVVSERLATLAAELGWQNISVADSADNDALLRTLLNT